MASGLKFENPVQPQGMDANEDWRALRQFSGDANGESAWSRQKLYTGFTHDTEYLMRLFNNGSGGLHLDIPSAFAVDGTSTTARNALVGESTADITGATTLNDTLHTVGAGTFDSTLDVTGAGTFQSTLHGVGAVTFDDVLGVAGAGTFGSNVDIAGDLTVGGAFTLTGAATLSGAVHLEDTLLVDGLGTFAAGIALSGGNLAFTTTGQRITGDLTNATVTNRTLFQTSTSNGITNVGAIPNGSGAGAAYDLYSTANPAASARLILYAGTTDHYLISDHAGASYLPLNIMAGGLVGQKFQANGDLIVGSGTAKKIGFYGAAGAVQGAVGAAATDPATTQTLANNIRTLLRDLGLSS